MKKELRALLNRAPGYKIIVKPFQPQQTWAPMTGYCTKDDDDKYAFHCYNAYNSFSS